MAEVRSLMEIISATGCCCFSFSNVHCATAVHREEYYEPRLTQRSFPAGFSAHSNQLYPSPSALTQTFANCSEIKTQT